MEKTTVIELPKFDKPDRAISLTPSLWAAPSHGCRIDFYRGGSGPTFHTLSLRRSSYAWNIVRLFAVDDHPAPLVGVVCHQPSSRRLEIVYVSTHNQPSFCGDGGALTYPEHFGGLQDVRDATQDPSDPRLSLLFMQVKGSTVDICTWQHARNEEPLCAHRLGAPELGSSQLWGCLAHNGRYCAVSMVTGSRETRQWSAAQLYDLSSGSAVAFREPLTSEQVGIRRGHSTWVKAVAPDGQRVVVANDQGLACYETEGGSQCWCDQDYAYDGSTVLSPDGNLLAFSTRSDTLKVVELKTHTIIESLHNHGTSIFASDSRSLVQWTKEAIVRSRLVT